MKSLMLILTILLSGCGKLDTGLTGRIDEYRLEDNTRCAVFIGYSKGGLSCDWRNYENN